MIIKKAGCHNMPNDTIIQYYCINEKLSLEDIEQLNQDGKFDYPSDWWYLTCHGNMTWIGKRYNSVATSEGCCRVINDADVAAPTKFDIRIQEAANQLTEKMKSPEGIESLEKAKTATKEHIIKVDKAMKHVMNVHKNLLKKLAE